jgi:hypothetical protein
MSTPPKVQPDDGEDLVAQRSELVATATDRIVNKHKPKQPEERYT